MAAIEIDDVHKSFHGKRGSKVNALKRVSLSVEEGEVFGFLGPNGAGKSTTIKILMGLIRPSAGCARILGQDIGSHRARKLVGYLPENPTFYDFLSGREFLWFVAKSFNMDDERIREKSKYVLELLSLWDARDRQIRSYSKGMVQRLGVAQALIHDPSVYIFDEPMSGLDPIGRALVKEIITDLKKEGKSVFFSTHITADVETVCDRVGIIVEGELHRVENVKSILSEGIIGYHLRIRNQDSEVMDEIEIPKDRLADTIAEIKASGREIAYVEPRRKDLEAFFLDIVKGDA